eukprot:Amastigsp_a512680_183.p2 type:complete len:239 gc:universal Amastigsp_a512680_183:731-15(-)
MQRLGPRARLVSAVVLVLPLLCFGVLPWARGQGDLVSNTTTVLYWGSATWLPLHCVLWSSLAYSQQGEDQESGRRASLFGLNLAAFASVPGGSLAAVFALLLFGAPLQTDREVTLLFSLFLGTSLFVPLLSTARMPTESLATAMVRTALGVRCPWSDPLDEARTAAAWGAVLGTWLGAFVLPLDHDRPYQVWPVPCMAGALLGLVIAALWLLASGICAGDKSSRMQSDGGVADADKSQ